MPILLIDDDSVAQAVDVLRSGSPVVIPTPSPLAYTITGTQAASVGDLAVARPGINNEAFGTDLNAYASDLSRRWQAGRQPA